MTITADQLAPAVSGSVNGGGATLTTTFNAQPSGSSLILVPVWSFNSVSSDSSGFSVTDNATTPNTYVQDNDFMQSGVGEMLTFRTTGRSLNFPASGNLQIKFVNNGTNSHRFALAARSYLGMQFANDGFEDSGSSQPINGMGLTYGFGQNIDGHLLFSVFMINYTNVVHPTIQSGNAPFTLITSITDGTTGVPGAVAECILPVPDNTNDTVVWNTTEFVSAPMASTLVGYKATLNIPVAGSDIALQAVKRAGNF